MPDRANWCLVALALAALACSGPPPAGELLLESADFLGGPLRLRLYLPEGGGPGRPFVIDDAQVVLGRPLVREAGRFDDAGRATLSCVPGCVAVLDGSNGCVTVTADHAFYSPTGGDQGYGLDGTILVCPVTGDPAARYLTLVPPADDPGASAPLSALELRASVPLDESTVSSMRIVRDGMELPLRYAGDSFEGVVILDPPVDPEGRIDVDVTGVRDVLGRPVDVASHLILTTAVLTDPSLDTAPPEGALAWFGAELEIASGSLVATDLGRWPRTRPFVALLALGDPGPATAVRVQGQQPMRFLGYGQVFARVARAGGVAGSAIRLPFDAFGVDVPVPAGTGPIWLLLFSDQSVPPPNDYAPPSFLTIDDLALVAP